MKYRKSFLVYDIDDWEFFFSIFNKFAKLIPPDFDSQKGKYIKKIVLFDLKGDSRYSVERTLQKINPELKLISNTKKSIFFEIVFYCGSGDEKVFFNFEIGQKNSRGNLLEACGFNLEGMDLGHGDFANLLRDLTEKQMKEF
jgi:hypothetical protein